MLVPDDGLSTSLDPGSVFLPLLSHAKAIVSSGVVIGYAVVLRWIVNAEDLKSNVVCDSSYFLGFLMTLISLMVGFNDFARNPVDRDIVTLIGAAGAALMTTFWGLIARMLHRLRYPPDVSDPLVGLVAAIENLHTGRAGGTEPKPDITAELEKLVADIAALRASTGDAVSAAGEGLSKAADALRGMHESLAADTRAALNDVSKELHTNTQIIVDELKEVNELAKTFRGVTIKKLVPTLEAVTAALENLLKVVERAARMQSWLSRLRRFFGL